MRFIHRFAAVVMVAGLVGGCGKAEDKGGTAGKSDPKEKAKGVEVAKSPLIKKAEIEDWCPEHGVPESVCTRCSADAKPFKDKKDWCGEHGLPESHCFKCNPARKDTFAADYEKKYGKKPPAIVEEKK